MSQYTKYWDSNQCDSETVSQYSKCWDSNQWESETEYGIDSNFAIVGLRGWDFKRAKVYSNSKFMNVQSIL